MTKTAPAKKAAEKKLKVGQAVRCTSANGSVREGRYVETQQVERADGRPGGAWVIVNFAPKGNKEKDLCRYRPKAVAAI